MVTSRFIKRLFFVFLLLPLSVVMPMMVPQEQSGDNLVAQFDLFERLIAQDKPAGPEFLEKYNRSVKQFVQFLNNSQVDRFIPQTVAQLQDWVSKNSLPDKQQEIALKKSLSAVVSIKKLVQLCKDDADQDKVLYIDHLKKVVNDALTLKGQLITLRNSFMLQDFSIEKVTPYLAKSIPELLASFKNEQSLVIVVEQAERFFAELLQLFQTRRQFSRDELVAWYKKIDKIFLDPTSPYKDTVEHGILNLLISSLNTEVRAKEQELYGAFAKNKKTRDDAVQLLQEVCSFNHMSPEEIAETQESEIQTMSRILARQLELFLAQPIDDASIVAKAQVLKAIAHAVIENQPDKISMLVFQATREQYLTCKEAYLTNKDSLFTIAQERSTSERSSAGAYRTFLSILTEFDQALAYFDSLYVHLTLGDWKASKPLGTMITWASTAYDMFYTILSVDSAVNQAHQKDSNSMLYAGLRWALRAANMTAEYAQEMHLMTQEQLAPQVLGTQDVSVNQRLLLFLNAFGTMSQPDNGVCELMMQKSTAGLAKNYGSGTVAAGRVLVKKYGQSFLHTTFGMGGELSFGAAFKEQATNMVVSALYYHTIRQYFFTNGTESGWVAKQSLWHHSVKSVIDLLVKQGSLELKNIIFSSLGAESSETLNTWTLGLINPDLIDCALGLAVDLSLTSPTVKRFLDKIVSFTPEQLFIGTWHAQMREAHPTVTDDHLRVLHADRTVVNYTAKNVGRFVGSTIFRHAGSLVKAVASKVLSYVEGSDLDINDVGIGILCQQYEEKKAMTVAMLAEKKQPISEQELAMVAFDLLLNQLATQPMLKISAKDYQVLRASFMADEQKNIMAIAQQLCNIIPANMVGKLGGFFVGKLSQSYVDQWWQNRVVRTGSPVIIPQYFFPTIN